MISFYSHNLFKTLGMAAIVLLASGICIDAFANGNPLQQAAGGIDAYCPADGTLFARIITCLENTIINAGVYFLEQFYPAVRDTVFIALILAAALFGSMMAVGAVERIEQETVTFILKLGGVVYFITNVVDIYNSFINILIGTLNSISNAAIYNGQLHCPAEATNAATTTPMWHRADCIFDMVIGLSAQAANNGGGAEDSLARGMMAFFYYNLQSGALGILVGLVGLYICFNLLMAMLKASYTYIIALITLTFLFILGALFMPLIMFSYGYSFFERWVKMALAMILQPLILFAYLNVLFVAFDVMLWSGDNSLMNTISGGQANSASFNLHQYAQDNGLYKEKGGQVGITADMNRSRLNQEAPGLNEGILGNSVMTDQHPDFLDPSQLPIHLKYQTVDYTKINGGAAALAGATLLVGLSSYILLQFMDEIPTLAQELGGGVATTPNSIGGGKGLELPLTKQISQAGDGLNKQLGSMLGRRG